MGQNPLRILGGEDFPQDAPITLNIGGGLFTGIIRGDEFTISSRRQPDHEARAQTIFDGIDADACPTPTPVQSFDFQMPVPPGRGDFFNPSTLRRHGLIICTSLQKTRPNVAQVAQHFWAEAGSRVVLASDEPIAYVASITPGAVLAVKAHKTLDGVRRLVNVPGDLWRVETKTYGTLSAVQVVLNKPLSSLEGQGWDDDLYVTYESTIGPNTVDILQYIIENWTDLDYDPVSFSYVRDKLAPFPSHFPVLDRKNTLELIREIAFQARCAIWLNGGTFYLKYLPEEPAADQTVTVSDMESGSIEVSLTPTEDLVTKMVVRWRLGYADRPNTIILRHNVAQYGTKQQEFDWYIYNQPDIILKAATFWLIRKSNTWLKLRFRGFLNLLRLETFDTINLQTPYVVKALVEQARYDSAANSIQFECLLPVKAGTTEKYKFFWPSALSVSDVLPGEAASGVTGELPIGFTDTLGSGGTVFVCGPNVVFRAQSHRGDRTPTDVGFVAQTILPADVFADVVAQANPNPDLTLNYIDPLPPPALAVHTATPAVIDIRQTKIIDSDQPGAESTLATILSEINSGALVIKTDAKFGIQRVPFDFWYDPETNQYGAGTAFLQE